MHMPFTPIQEQPRAWPGASPLNSEQDSVHLAQLERSRFTNSVVPAHFSQLTITKPPVGNDDHNLPAVDGLQ